MVIDPYTHYLLKDRLPWRSGRFVMGVGLKNAPESLILDTETFYQAYVAQKKERRKEKLERYYPYTFGLSAEEIKRASEKLKSFIPPSIPFYKDNYRDPFDEVVSQIPEDVSLWKKDNAGREWLAAIHLCAPNHWAAEDKIGKSFIESHLPVPKIAPIAQIAGKIFDQSVERGLQERMAWGVATDTILNHHPEAPFKGRSFNSEIPELYARIERQTLIPVESNLLIFTIRTYFVDIAQLKREDRDLICLCMQSMDEEILKYKGLVKDREKQVEWMQSF